MEDDGEGDPDVTVSLPPLPSGGALAPRLESAGNTSEQTPTDGQTGTATPDPPPTPDPGPTPARSHPSAPVRPKPVWKPPAQLPPWRQPSAKGATTPRPQAPASPRAKRPAQRQGAGLVLPASTNARSKRVPRKLRPRTRPQAKQQPDLGPYEQVALFAIYFAMTVAGFGLLVAFIIAALTS